MRQGGGKAKGSAWERAVAKDLSQWYYGDPNYLIRSQSSGAMATVRGNGLIPGGDIFQIKIGVKEFPFSVECKALKEFLIDDILFKREKTISYKAWLQCIGDAEKTKKIPMLIGKGNRRDAYIICPVGLKDIWFPNLLTCSNDEVIIAVYKNFLLAKPMGE